MTRSVTAVATSEPNRYGVTRRGAVERLMSSPWGKHVPIAAALLAILTGMELAGRLGDGLIFPPATAVFAALVDLITSGRLLEALIPSLQLLFSGLGAAVLVGTASGFLVARSRRVDAVTAPYVAALYATPEIALVPILVVWFGYDFPGRFVIVFLAAVFPMLYNVSAGVRTAPRDLEDMAVSFVVPRWSILTQVVFPAALPFVIAGLRQSIGRAIVGMIVAEAYLRLGGLGGLVFIFGARFSTDYLLAAILVLPVLGLALTKLVDLGERRFAPWVQR
jgi:ABC-type nitrate/sulfonate/bicarbonate transport system permease component